MSGSVPNLCRHAIYTGQVCQDCVDDEEIMNILSEALLRVGGFKRTFITPITNREFMLRALEAIDRISEKRAKV